MKEQDCDQRHWEEHDQLHVGGGGGGATFIYQITWADSLRISTSDSRTSNVSDTSTKNAAIAQSVFDGLGKLHRRPLLIAGGGGGGGSWSSAQFNGGEPGKSFDDIFLFYSNLLNDPQTKQAHAFGGSWNHSMRPPLRPVDGSSFMHLHFDLDLLKESAAFLNLDMNVLLQMSFKSNQSFLNFGGKLCTDKKFPVRIQGGFGGGGGSCRCVALFSFLNVDLSLYVCC